MKVVKRYKLPQQGSTAQHGELQSILCDNYKGKESEKIDTDVYTPKTNTAL